MKSLNTLRNLEGTKIINKETQKKISGGKGLFCCGNGDEMTCTEWCVYWL